MPIGKARFRISDYNEKRKADVRGKERSIRMVSLSLTSMVDMFAILVIYLVAQSDTVSQWLDVGHGIEIPKARHSSTPPKKAATLKLSRESVFGGDSPILSMDELLKGPDVVPSVQQWLASNKPPEEQQGYVNIVADERLPFGAIRRVVASAQAAGFANVNLAVEPRSN